MVRTKVKNKGSKSVMVRTKVKNKGSKSGAASASIKTSSSTSSSSATPKLIRTISCPGAATTTAKSLSSIKTSKHASIDSNANANANGRRNDVFLPPDKVQPSRIRSLYSTTIEDDFSDEAFLTKEIFPDVDVSYDNSRTTKQYTSNVTTDGNYYTTDNNNIAQQHLSCDDNSHEDTTVILDNSNRSTISQLSADAALQPSPLDPFLDAQQKHRQEQMQEQQRRQQHKCQLLQLQILELQNRIVHINQNRQQHSQQIAPQQNNNSTNSSYLCNGIAAIEPIDRSTRTISCPISPGKANLHRSFSNCNNSSSSHLNHPAQDDSYELHMLNPTPIFSPFENDRINCNNNCSISNSNKNNSNNINICRNSGIASDNLTIDFLTII